MGKLRSRKASATRQATDRAVAPSLRSVLDQRRAGLGRGLGSILGDFALMTPAERAVTTAGAVGSMGGDGK